MKNELEEHVIRCYVTEDNWLRLDRAEQLAREKGLTIPQIALAYVLNQPMDVFALVGAFTAEEIAANTRALEIELSRDEREWLDLKRDARD
jgi:aryl-alcohol dehydrogenase-like predicted oxidoreductase